MDWARSDREWDPLGSLDVTECNVCTASVEKRIKMQQAWQLWQIFLDTFSQYENWLQGAEQMAACPKSSQVLYVDAKEELKKFEVLHRQVQERLGQLESLNRQYWRLVTKGTPADSKANGNGLKARLRAIAQESNQRWDTLQKQVLAIHRRLKYFVSQREEFEHEWEAIKMCLTELDLRLTDVQHFSNGNTLQKMQQLQTFQQYVQSSAERVDWLLVLGERLIQRSEPLDAECLEEELQEVSSYCQEVFNRVSSFQRRLISIRLVFEEDWLAERESDLDSDCFSDVLEKDEREDERKWGESEAHPTLDLCGNPQHRLIKDHRPWAAPPRSSSVDLEWDPSVDVGGSTSCDDDSSYFSTGTGKSGIWHWEEASPQKPKPCEQQLTYSTVCVRSRKDAELLVQISQDSMEDCDTRSDSGTWTSSRQRIPYCPMGAPDSNTQNISDSLVEKTGTCCQTDRSTFDQEWIESWLGQTQSEQRLETERSQPDLSQGFLQPASCCHLSPMEIKSAPEQPVANSTNNCCRRNGQPISTSRANQRLVKKWKPCSTQEVTATIEKRAGSSPVSLMAEELLLPLKTPLLLWLRTRGHLLVLLALLLLACLLLFLLRETPCAKANHYAWSFHLMLKYVNGPPPM